MPAPNNPWTRELAGSKGDDSSVDDRDDRRPLFEVPKPRPGKPMDKDDAMRGYPKTYHQKT